jgi:hypothetical protein
MTQDQFRDIIDARIKDTKARRTIFLDMAKGYQGLKDSHGIADAGMELQALDRVISTLLDIKDEINS